MSGKIEYLGMEMSKLGARLKALYDASGMTQEDIVEATGTDMNVRTFQRLLKGEGNPAIKTLAGLAQALKIPLVELLDFNGQQRPSNLPDWAEAVLAKLNELALTPEEMHLLGIFRRCDRIRRGSILNQAEGALHLKARKVPRTKKTV